MIVINKKLERIFEVGTRKARTVPRRLPRRLRAGLSNEAQFVYDVIYGAWEFVEAKNRGAEIKAGTGRYMFGKMTTAHAEKARKHWDNIFAKIVPSKQKEAQTAYDQTRATLTMIRALIKQEMGEV